MADIELVIKMAQESYNNLKMGCVQRVSNDEMIEALKNGIPVDAIDSQTSTIIEADKVESEAKK